MAEHKNEKHGNHGSNYCWEGENKIAPVLPVGFHCFKKISFKTNQDLKEMAVESPHNILTCMYELFHNKNEL